MMSQTEQQEITMCMLYISVSKGNQAMKFD